MQVWRRTSRMLTVQRAESGGVVHVEFVGRVSGARSVIDLLASAVHEPGNLSQAYQQFHTYSQILKAGTSRGGR